MYRFPKRVLDVFKRQMQNCYEIFEKINNLNITDYISLLNVLQYERVLYRFDIVGFCYDMYDAFFNEKNKKGIVWR